VVLIVGTNSSISESNVITLGLIGSSSDDVVFSSDRGF
jgi:hypothetical protein